MEAGRNPRIADLEDLFDAAVDLGAEARQAFLDRACAGHTELRQQLEVLLAADPYPTVSRLKHFRLADDNKPGRESIIGTTAGGYEIKAHLASGGMGEVYLAEHRLIGRRAAVKVVRSDLSRDRVAIARFFNEARVTSAISHPGIVDVFDVGYHENGRAFYIMEYIAGKTLHDRLDRKGPLTAGHAIALMKQITGALTAAHARGVVHRDLKPANIMVVGDPGVEFGERIKIVDFGIAKQLGAVEMSAHDSGQTSWHAMHSRVLTEPSGRAAGHSIAGLETMNGVVMGTPAYMAPEQSRCASTVDHRADLYALGCIMFHMLCGQPPFFGHRDHKILQRQQTVPAPSLRALVPSLDRATEALILRLLAKNPQQRVPGAQQLLIELDRLTQYKEAFPHLRWPS
ncbi:MAG: serine/threonine protein kinase [Proteobacteria bacterium]|nr:serine/threonine protein kinase [Pseudomonadota bacterium]